MASLGDEIARRGLAWIAGHHAEFRVPLDAGPPRFFLGLKMVAELAQTADVLLQYGVGDPAVLRSWIERGWRELRGGDLLARAIAAHEDLILLATAYVPFHRHGMASRAVEEVIRERGARAVVAPARRFYLAWALDALGMESPVPFGEALRASPLGAPRDLAAPGWEEAYGFTHAVFYATGWGLRRADLPGDIAAHLPQDLPIWLGWCERNGKIDLLAELIMVAHCIGEACAPTSAWRALAAAQDPDGMVSESAGEDAHPLGTDDRARNRVLRNFHPTLVAITAGAMCRHEETR